MKYLIILAVLTLACSGEDINPTEKCRSMTISDANPVQFWPVGCETWNESRPPSVNHYCFCQPWECDDEIRVEFESDEEIQVTEIQSEFNSDLDGWFNTANGTTPATGGSTADWAWSSDLGSSAKVTTFDVFGTKRIRLSSLSLPQKPFTIRIKFAIPAVRNSDDLSFSFVIRDVSNTQLENVEFGVSSTGSEEVEEILITSSSVWAVADHFLIAVNSTNFVAGDDLHITEISYVYDNEVAYRLKGFNDADELVMNLPFSRAGTTHSVSFIPSEVGVCDEQIALKIFTTQGEQIEVDELADWVNEDTGGPAWTPGAAPTVTLPGSATITDNLVGGAIATFSGDFSFDYDLDLSSASGLSGLDLWVVLYKSGLQVGTNNDGITSSDGNKIGTIEVTSSDIPDEVKVYLSNSVGSVNVTFNSFVPSNIVAPDVEVFKSDCQDIRTSHDETVLINYTNHSNFAGIPYRSQSPDPSFNIRIPAKFFEDRFPQEGEDFQLSSNIIIALNDQVTMQRQLETGRMPKYMHKKMVQVLMHQFLYIDGEYWVKGREEYSKLENKNKRDSFFRYTCWVTNQDFVVRNIL